MKLHESMTYVNTAGTHLNLLSGIYGDREEYKSNVDEALYSLHNYICTAGFTKTFPSVYTLLMHAFQRKNKLVTCLFFL